MKRRAVELRMNGWWCCSWAVSAANCRGGAMVMCEFVVIDELKAIMMTIAPYLVLIPIFGSRRIYSY